MIDQETSYPGFNLLDSRCAWKVLCCFHIFGDMEFMWLENRFFKVCSVSPMYMLDLLVSFFGVTFLLQMMLGSWKLPFRGQFSLSLQLQPFVAFSAVSVVIFLL